MTNFENHKNDIATFFSGKFISDDFIEVDNEIAKGFIFFYKLSDYKHFLVFNLEIKQPIDYELDYSKAQHFSRLAAFFNNEIYVKSLKENTEQLISYDGFYTSDKNVRIKGKLKKGEYLQHISFFYTEELFDIILNEQVRKYYQTQNHFLIYLDNRSELNNFKKTLLTIFSYPPEIIGQVLKVKLQELKFIFLARLFNLDIEKLDIKNSSITNYQLKILFEIRTTILEDLREKPNVGDFIAKYGIHKTLLQSLFQETFGYTIYNFFTIQRMEKTKEELIDKKMSTTEIAYEYGFSDVQHFSKQFKKFFGETPSKFYTKFNVN
ncbi:helix-turn-helix domain-containing protein [Flammeovirga kamogawensis]|uniref:AraC family transcriptional regulator n=1 Tax=Flammeovirga kamogawensis TaxID=373891 RepID=A0ABX8GRN1_9BACT|nr:helix-turn-helix domain-containing protein [Flammeovirga kamogawensis]MBB6462684.1 AraC-like DNA-binding protein [Flammeovirga kamogawensis]QWG06079.1 AraC family transcriptional regulator [Flammeovirga kamogawensis]